MQFNEFMELLSTTNSTLDFFVDFEKVSKNINKIAIKLNQLNYLVGKENIDQAIRELYNENPNCFSVLNILIAVRDNREVLAPNGEIVFLNTYFSDENNIIEFVNETGISGILKNKDIKNLVDYVFGIEVGLDTNARKNRGGKNMEKLIASMFNKNNIPFETEIKSDTYYQQNTRHTNGLQDLMFEQTFKNIDDVLWKEAGCTTELDYTEQTSWMLFLKYLDDLEHERSMEAQLTGKSYEFIIEAEYRWSSWAAPKTADGSFDHDGALTGDDLILFVNNHLFPYLQGFKERASSPDTIEYKIGEIFGEIRNKFQSGYSLRDALELIDSQSFRSQQEKHELSHLYEAKIRNMGNAGRNGGEYYTPRPLIRAMIRVTRPKIGERIYDGAAGSAGFLCEAHDYLRYRPNSYDAGNGSGSRLSTKDLDTLQHRTFYAKEKKSLPYVIGIMNMILHGIETPNIVHTNSLTENISDIQEKDRFDVILANPPFGGKERKEVQQNFPIKTGETAFLFLQHFMKYLKAGGRAAVVIKNTFLSNSDNASRALRRELLETCNLHTVLDCPGGTFLGAGVKTVVLFFEKGAPTRRIWYYQLDPGRSLGKTNPLNDTDLKEFVELQTSVADSELSWTVDVNDIDPETLDLSVKNPNKAEERPLREPEVIINEIQTLDKESEEILEEIRGML